MRLPYINSLFYNFNNGLIFYSFIINEGKTAKMLFLNAGFLMLDAGYTRIEQYPASRNHQVSKIKHQIVAAHIPGPNDHSLRVHSLSVAELVDVVAVHLR